ncbi:MAG: cytochrome P450 [Actinobacteria bacterium]|nr:cytochrome P450 [Actinomycetota bacterium]NBP54221.1 cytochrome P450 [Actinomycetota bacterium]
MKNKIPNDTIEKGKMSEDDDTSRSSLSTAQFDDNLVCDAAVRDPYAFFGHLRDNAPIHWNTRHKAWVLTTHELVTAALRNGSLTADRMEPFRASVMRQTNSAAVDETFRILANWMVFLDPPNHTRLRRLVSRIFAPPVVRAQTADIQEVVESLIADLPEDRPVDFIAEFAAPLPAIVIAKMLGVPPQDRILFKEWSDQLTSLVFGAYDNPDRFHQAARGMLDLRDYLLGMIEKFEVAPEDNLISLLLEQEDGDSLSRDELISTCTLLLFGGHETTTNLITNGLLALLDFPDQMDDLRRNPDIMPIALEEITRFDGPARSMVRLVKEDHEFGGVEMKAGERVFLVNPSANRDPAVFSDPDALNLRRNPTSHIGYGFGLHYCLGAPLARLEADLALSAILREFGSITMATERSTLEWNPTMLSRGLKSLPVVLARG